LNQIKKEALQQGLVVAAYGKRYGVELADGLQISCVTRGKKNDLACGDRVEVKMTDTHEGVVERTAAQRYNMAAYRAVYFQRLLI
jgi:ribosome biogenesis GTPase